MAKAFSYMLLQAVVLASTIRDAACVGEVAATCLSGSDTCQTRGAVTPTRDHILLQQEIKEQMSIKSVRKRKGPVQYNKARVTSDCAERLQDFGAQGGAACIVVRNNRALLVKVPYGRTPGWDLPGGLGDKGHEAACETAEREVCEETKYQVRAVAKLSPNVFKCEVVAENVCTQSVDEGFLKLGWFSRGQLDSLRFRGGTWGNKQGLLKQHVTAQRVIGVDECGCRRGQEGWSTTRHHCDPKSDTDSSEAEQCSAMKGEIDECGCVKRQEGWSSTRNTCHVDSDTDPQEAKQCSIS